MKFNKKWLWLIIPIMIISLVCLNASSVSTVLLAIQGVITDGNLVKFKGVNGVGEDTGLAATNVVKCNFAANTAPTVDNDIDEDYTVGSRWLDVTNDKSYVCLDNADGAAVWIETTGAGNGAGTFLELTDTPVAYEDGKYAKSTAEGVVWDTPAGAGTVDTSGTPVQYDYARFTGATTIEGREYSEVRTDLGLVIGTNVQAHDAGLLSLAGLTYASPSFIKVTAEDTYVYRTIAEIITDLALDSDDLSDVASIAMLDENEAITGAWTVTGSIGGVNTTEFGYLATITAFGASIIDDADEATFKATVNLEIGTDVLAYQAIGIADDNLVEIDDADAAVDDYCKLTANGIAGRSYTEVKEDLALNNVENTALSTWAGTESITTLGTIATGVWQGTAIADEYIPDDITITEADPTVDTQGEIETILTYSLDDTAGDGDTDKLWSANKIYDQLVLKITDTANAIDSDHYTDTSIDHEHLAPDVITGLAEVTSTDLDMMIVADQSDSWALKKVDMAEVLGAGGAETYLELTDTPAAYDNGKYAKSTADGVVWDTPAGAGDMTKATYDTDADDIVDKAETVDDGAGNSSTAADVKDAVTKKHTQNTDTMFDFANALGSDHLYSGEVDSQPVGENVVFGQLLYYDWGDVEWKLAKADAFATAKATRIALESKGDGETCLMLVKGYIRDESAFDFGAARVFLNDDTAGTCDDTAPAESGDQIFVVGEAKSADILFFDPGKDVGEI